MFTQKYIELAKNEKVQGLRTELEYFDMYCFISNQREFKVYGYDIISERNKLIWLPTGDQIEQEIVKILDKRKQEYEVKRIWRNGQFGLQKEPFWRVAGWWKGKTTHLVYYDINPLIAKLKLLMSLLEAQDE